jgi:hypothetical protein
LRRHKPEPRLAGRLVFPDDPRWEQARQAWNLAADQQPAAVGLPESVEDVIAMIAYSSERGLRVAPQSTGHAAGALDDLGRTLLLKTSSMRGARVDPKTRAARAQAGAVWSDVTAAAAPYGLAALAGSAADVGVLGYTLGGGVSWIARRYGLACNSVTAAELVTAHGAHVRVDSRHEPELFWALRGGGGNFGVVTALEFTLYPVRDVYAGALFWPLERAQEILEAWSRWTATVPDEVTSIGRLLRLPDLPHISDTLRGRSFVAVEAAIISAPPSKGDMLAPLRALGPEFDTFSMIPASALDRLHMDPPRPVPGLGDSMLLSELPADAIDALISTAGPESRSPLFSVELRHLGGAINKPPHGHGALAALDAAFALFAVGMVHSPDIRNAVSTHLASVMRGLSPWDAGQRALTFAQQPTDPQSVHPAKTLERLRAVKASYDPENVFQASASIEPALNPHTSREEPRT